jgi:hypothetical protein
MNIGTYRCESARMPIHLKKVYTIFKKVRGMYEDIVTLQNTILSITKNSFPLLLVLSVTLQNTILSITKNSFPLLLVLRYVCTLCQLYNNKRDLWEKVYCITINP